MMAQCAEPVCYFSFCEAVRLEVGLALRVDPRKSPRRAVHCKVTALGLVAMDTVPALCNIHSPSLVCH